MNHSPGALVTLPISEYEDLRESVSNLEKHFVEIDIALRKVFNISAHELLQEYLRIKDLPEGMMSGKAGFRL